VAAETERALVMKRWVQYTLVATPFAGLALLARVNRAAAGGVR
jgi:hypothetical protein